MLIDRGIFLLYKVAECGRLRSVTSCGVQPAVERCALHHAPGFCPKSDQSAKRGVEAVSMLWRALEEDTYLARRPSNTEKKRKRGSGTSRTAAIAGRLLVIESQVKQKPKSH